MARLPRLHRVVARWADGTVRTRNYLTPEAAEDRRAVWAGERAPVEERDPDAQPDAATEVTVTPSYPVTWPGMESDRFDIPDSIVSRELWNDLGARLGIKPEAILSITVGAESLSVQYDPDPRKPGKREPRTWTVYIENEEN